MEKRGNYTGASRLLEKGVAKLDPDCKQRYEHPASSIEGYNARARKLIETIQANSQKLKKTQQERDAIEQENSSLLGLIKSMRESSEKYHTRED